MGNWYHVFIQWALTFQMQTCTLPVHHREFIFIVGIQFGHICFTPPSLSLFQSPSFSHPPTPKSITLSHTLLIGWIVLNGKKEKGVKKERERDEEGMRER